MNLSVFSNRCLQSKELLEGLMTFLSMKVELPDVSEDCLYLNVFAPSHAAPGSDLPVRVLGEDRSMLYPDHV